MAKEIEIVNAVIESSRIEIEDHGLLTVWLMLDYGGSGQGFGGYCLGSSKPLNDKHNTMGHFVRRILEVVGVNDWDKLDGKTIRVKKPEGFQGRIIAIGNIIKDDWFCPEDDFAKLKGE